MVKRTKKRKKAAPRDDAKKSLPQLRRKLWKVMSQGVRDQWRNEDGTTQCYTCREQIPKEGKVDCGHGWPKRKYKGTYYHEHNLRPQCVSCNMAGQGEQWSFFLNLIEDIGMDEFEAMCDLRDNPWETNKQWYIDEIKRWQT